MRIVIIPEDNLISVDNEFLQFSFSPLQENIHAIAWYGDKETGHGEIEFKDDYNIKIWPALFDEEIQPYLDLFEAEKRRLLKEKQEEEIARIEEIESEDYRFARLREFRDRKLIEYDKHISFLNRKLELSENEQEKALIKAKIREWNLYAEDLCNLPQQKDAPWDDKTLIPWPKEPV